MEQNKIDPRSLPYSENYCCSKCGTKCPDEEYYIEGEKYPKYYDKYTSFYGIMDWVEVHCCPKCKTLYYFENGD